MAVVAHLEVDGDVKALRLLIVEHQRSERPFSRRGGAASVERRGLLEVKGQRGKLRRGRRRAP